MELLIYAWTSPCCYAELHIGKFFLREKSFNFLFHARHFAKAFRRGGKYQETGKKIRPHVHVTEPRLGGGRILKWGLNCVKAYTTVIRSNGFNGLNSSNG